MLNDILYFPVVTKVEDELGQVEYIRDYTRQVFCAKKSVPQSEFFQAGMSGIKASCVLIVNRFDYLNEETVKYNDKIYSIYRIYDRPDERTELYCSVKAGV